MYRDLLRYNVRICAGLGAWMLVVPVGSAMLVLFAVMAIESLVRDYTAVRVLELLGSLVMAFAGANLLRPEYQYHTLETVLTRPVSFRATVAVRMFGAGVGVLLLEAGLALYMDRVMDKEFDMGLALLAALASMAFLTAFAVATAAVWRSPTLGFVAAAALWGADVAFSGELSPLLTLGGYGLALQHPDGIWTPWWVGKAALVLLAVVLAFVAARAGARPASPWNARRVVRAALAAVLIMVAYLGTGVVQKVRWGMAREAELGNRSRLAYQRLFACYGPLPVAHLAGPSFARFIGYQAPWTELMTDPDGRLGDETYTQQEQLRRVAFDPSPSQWTDNALYELGRKLMPDTDDAAASGDHRLALQCLELLRDEYADSPFAARGLEKLAYAYERMGRPADAEEALRRLVTTYPESETARNVGQAFAVTLAEEGRMEEALATLATLADHAPDDARASLLVQLGEYLSDDRVGRIDEAMARYEEAERLCAQVAQEVTALDDPGREDLARLREASSLRTQARERREALQQRRQGRGPL
jgi:tetratricopeptide (TPR) repeat protein